MPTRGNGWKVPPLCSMAVSANYFLTASLLLLPQLSMGLVGRIPLDSKLYAGENQTWVSENGTFAFGFAESGSGDGFHLAIWYAELPGVRTTVWSANRDVAVEKGAVVRFKPDGDLVLEGRGRPVWCSNTSRYGATTAAMLESGNLVIFSGDGDVAWQSSWHPTDTLLPGQPLNASLELASPRTPLGYYSLKMLQQASSLTLALSYVSQESDPAVPESYANYTYWSGPQISNATGDIAAMLDKSGNFVITYGASAAGTVYIHTNDTAGSTLHLRRIKIEPDGNLRLYRWDGPGGGWVTEWSAVSNPCQVAGICGNGICSLDGRKTRASCSCPPGTSPAGFERGGCTSDVLSPPPGNCTNSYTTGAVRMATMSQTNYYFSGPSILANHSNVNSSSQCSDYCLSDCRCVAAVHGLSQGDAQCWTLRHLVFGGFQDPSSTLFMKAGNNGSLAGTTPGIGRGRAGGSSSDVSKRSLALFLPLVLCFSLLAALLSLLLYYHIYGKRLGRLKTLSRCLTVPGAPLNFTYQELQAATSNFSQPLGTGGFGTVYKGRLGDGTLVAVKKLEKMLPQGEREFITEVTTIGSMHHMNLVRLCGFCSEGSHRLLVYEYMSNGSLDQWIFPSRCNPGSSRLLDWRTRFRIAADIAQGVAYFHEQCRDRIIHCDIKPENILLDENFCPKVSDFGLAKMMGREHSHVVTMVRGTRGYLAPEWVSNRPVTVKADVYSYGMLLLEIVGGRRNLDMSLDAEDFFYPGWAFKEMMDGNPAKAADKRLQGEVAEEEVVRALNAAFWCIQEDVWARPTMGEVIRILEGSAEMRVPPVPQAVVEIMEEGLRSVYKAMRRSYFVHQVSSSAVVTSTPSSLAACSNSTMSPR